MFQVCLAVSIVSSDPYSLLLALAAAKWRYSAIVEQLRERLESMKDRLEAKDGQLDEYRERLHLVPARGSEFSRLTQSELKEKALIFVRDLRRWLATVSEQDNHHLNQKCNDTGEKRRRKGTSLAPVYHCVVATITDA
jgi:hypothetical protein